MLNEQFNILALSLQKWDKIFFIHDVKLFENPRYSVLYGLKW